MLVMYITKHSKIRNKNIKNKYEGILIVNPWTSQCEPHRFTYTQIFFSKYTLHNPRSWLNLHIQRANCKVTCGFLTVWGSVHWPPCSRISCNSVSPSVIMCAHFGDHCWGVGDSNLIIIPSPCPVVYRGGKRDEHPEGGVCLWSIPCLSPLLWLRHSQCGFQPCFPFKPSFHCWEITVFSSW